MGQIISFINMKGGVGKTTIAVNIGYALAVHHGMKVLLVDADPQFNASTYLMTDKQYLQHLSEKKKKTILDIFLPHRHDGVSTLRGTKRSSGRGPVTLATCTHRVVAASGGHLDLIPSTLALMEIQNSQRGTENRLANFLKTKKNAYDYVLIDCPPTISIFTLAAILASEKYVVPLKPDPLSATGLPLLERWLYETMESAGITVEMVGIVFCMVRSPITNTMDRIIKDLRQQRGEEVFDAYLTQSTDVATTVEAHQPVVAYRPGTKWATDVHEITEEFLERTGGA